MSKCPGNDRHIDASPSPYHCVEETARRLAAAGFIQLDQDAAWETLNAGQGHYVKRNGTLVAWRNGSGAPAEVGFRLVGAHTDSPNLRLKPNAEYLAHGIRQWGIQVYGGVLLYTWFDRDLGLSGRIFVRGEHGPEPRLVRIDRPIARVPSLAIHFNRSVMTDGFKPNAQKHLPPVVGLELASDEAALERLLADTVGANPGDVVGHDLMLHDLQKSALGGLDEEFIFAPRLDNQASCYTALEGLLASNVGAPTAVCVVFDHEECGSQSAHGGDGALLEHILRRIVATHEAQANGGFERAAAASFMVSADMAHALHPNYADQHDGHHKPLLGGGPVIKTTYQSAVRDGWRDLCHFSDGMRSG